MILGLFMILTGYVFSSAHAQSLSPQQRANFLSERVYFLSSYNALQYIDRYDQLTETCLAGAERSRDRVGQCLDKAAQQIAEIARQDDPRTYLIHRLSRLADRQYLSLFQLPDLTRPTLGIAGDSLATGANADLRLTPHLWKLLGHGLFDFLFIHAGASQRVMPVKKSLLRQPELFTHGTKAHLAPLTRVYDTPQDHKLGFERAMENRGSSWVDCEECSFAYLLGRRLDIPATNIFMAAQIGKRISSLGQQLERLALPLGHLPDFVIVSYTGNDMCNMSNMKETGASKFGSYAQEMIRQFMKMKEIKPAPNGTKVFVVAAANVGYLVASEHILKKKVEYNYGWPMSTQSLTCADFRRESHPGLKNLNGMCNLILRTAPDNHPRIAKIRELHQAIVNAQRAATNWAAEHLHGQGYSFVFTDSSLQTPFDGEDISNDCFHPSIRGHEKLAEQVLSDFTAYLAPAGQKTATPSEVPAR